MKRNVMWIGGLSVLLLGLLGAVVFSLMASPGNVAAYAGNGNGPGGRWSQTISGTTTTGPGYDCCVYAGGQMGQRASAGMGMGMMMNGNGRGAGRGGPGANLPISTGPLSEETKQFLTRAIQNEYQARALYEAVVTRYGQVLPFTNIARAESTHVAALSRLFTNHALSVPADTFAGKVTAPATLSEAFKLAIQTESANGAMYDGFLKTVQETDVVRVFSQLSSASTQMHLKAFEYYNK